MINHLYKLIQPFLIERCCDTIDIQDPDRVIVRPKLLSICKADMRYYMGQRDPEVLKKRLPMALIHEACGEVLYDPTGQFQKYDKVVLLPNMGGKDTFYLENYRLDSVFRSSKADGFMQELVSLDPAHLVSYQRTGMDEVFAFTEFISVAVHAVDSFLKISHDRRERICVFGDGALSYAVCSVLRKQLPHAHIAVMGKHNSKLQYFNFVNETINIQYQPIHNLYDHAFECTGGAGCTKAIDQIIDVIQPQGTIMLLGVSEEPVPIATRMVLEKGLTIQGRSRSGRKDFEKAVDWLEHDDKFASRMKHLVSEKVDVSSINDIGTAFDLATTANFKVIMNWMM